MSHQDAFCKKSFLKNLTKFIEKRLSLSLFLIKPTCRQQAQQRDVSGNLFNDLEELLMVLEKGVFK